MNRWQSVGLIYGLLLFALFVICPSCYMLSWVPQNLKWWVTLMSIQDSNLSKLHSCSFGHKICVAHYKCDGIIKEFVNNLLHAVCVILMLHWLPSNLGISISTFDNISLGALQFAIAAWIRSTTYLLFWSSGVSLFFCFLTNSWNASC